MLGAGKMAGAWGDTVLAPGAHRYCEEDNGDTIVIVRLGGKLRGLGGDCSCRKGVSVSYN